MSLHYNGGPAESYKRRCQSRLHIEPLEDRTLLAGSVGIELAGDSFAEFAAKEIQAAAAMIESVIEVSFDRVTSLTLHVGDVRENAGPGVVQGTVTRETDVLDDPLTVFLSADDSSEVALPDSVVIIPAGMSSASFLIDAVDDDILDGNQTVTITATSNEHGEFASVSTTLVVTDYELLSIELESYAVHESSTGSVLMATVTRYNSDIDEPLLIHVAVNDSPDVLVPDTITIEANQTSTTFPITITHDAQASGPKTIPFDMQALHYFMGSTTLAILEVDLDELPSRSLESLNYTVFNGVQRGDGSGDYVRTIGDMNGDGFDDFLIAAVEATRISPEYDDSGEVYVIFGTPDGYSPVVELADLDGSNGFTITGHLPGGELGYEVSNGGDVNGDGFSDMIVATSYFDPDLVEGDPPHVFVIFGKGTPFDAVLDLRDLDGTNGFAINALPGDFGDPVGDSFDIGGDFNGDGFNDILLGAPHSSSVGFGFDDGAAFVVFGKAGGFVPVFDLATLDGSNGFIFYGDLNHRDFADDVKFAGDFNDDGFGDILVGSDNNTANPAETFVVFGKEGGFSATLAASQIDGTNGFVFSGADNGHQVGEEVTNLGDINGDGIPDMMVWESNSGFALGQAHVLFGRAGSYPQSISPDSLDGSNGFTITGIQENDNFAEKLSFAEDINGDGIDDFLIGAYYTNLPHAEKVGAVYVLFGTRDGFSAQVDIANLTASQGFVIYGETPGDYFGTGVSAAGDVNGDGVGDFLIGARNASPNGLESAGITYLIYGEDFTGTVTHEGDEFDNLLSGDSAANFMIGGTGNDTLVGQGGADTISGGSGDDILTISDTSFQSLDGGSGFDTLRLSGASQSFFGASHLLGSTSLDLDLTAVPNRRFLGIELIDITGSGANVLTLDQLVVLNLSGTSNTLLVRADPEDTINLGGGWSLSGVEVIDTEEYSVYQQGAAKLKVHVGVPVLGFTDNSGTAGDAAVQFSTHVPQQGLVETEAYYVRPAFPDSSKTVEITNVGNSLLTIHEIIVNAPNVTTDIMLTAAAGDDVVLGVGASLVVTLTYAPTSPNHQSSLGESFSLNDGLVILTNSANMPTLQIALSGASTFNSDLNYDGSVNFAELGLINANFGLTDQDPGYNVAFDINGDGAINFGDLGSLNIEFGKTLNPPAQISPSLPEQVASAQTLQIQAVTQTELPDAFSKNADLTAEDYAKRMAAANQPTENDSEASIESANSSYAAVFEELGGGMRADDDLFDFTEERWSDWDLVLELL